MVELVKEQAEREHKDELWKMISEAVIKYVSLYPEDEHKGPALKSLIEGHKDLFPERHKRNKGEKNEKCNDI